MSFKTFLNVILKIIIIIVIITTTTMIMVHFSNPYTDFLKFLLLLLACEKCVMGIGYFTLPKVPPFYHTVPVSCEQFLI